MITVRRSEAKQRSAACVYLTCPIHAMDQYSLCNPWLAFFDAEAEAEIIMGWNPLLLQGCTELGWIGLMIKHDTYLLLGDSTTLFHASSRLDLTLGTWKANDIDIGRTVEGVEEVLEVTEEVEEKSLRFQRTLT